MAIIKIYFVRHGLTNSNVRGKFSGRSDVLVNDDGREALKNLKKNYEYPEVERVFCSPAIRCIETASILYPEHEVEILEGFWEQNFGQTEGVTLEDWRKTDKINPDKWLTQDLSCMFRGGESILEARFRVLSAMTHLVQLCTEENLSEVAIVAHGQILGLLLKACLVTDEPREAFLLCPNGMGYVGTVDSGKWFETQEILFQGFLPEGALRPRPEDSPYFKKQRK